MPKIFSPEDRRTIENHLLEIGKGKLLHSSCQQISVDLIAMEAGIAKGTFYSFFESKNQYLKAIVDDINEDQRRELEQLFSQGLPGRDQVRQYLIRRFAEGYTLYDYFTVEELRRIFRTFPTEGESPESSRFLLTLLQDPQPDPTNQAVVVNLYNVLAMTATQLHKLQVGGKRETLEVLVEALLDQIYGREER